MMITKMKSTGNQTFSALIAEKLLEEQVEVIFTSPQQVLSPLHYSISKTKQMRTSLMNHEQAIVHAADGYARATGKIGCVIIQGGCGFANAVTGIATAQMDSVPLVIFCVNPQNQHNKDLPNDNLVDTFGMTLPIVKYHYRINGDNNFLQVVKDAFEFAINGRPGPVVIEIEEEQLMQNVGSRKDNIPAVRKTVNLERKISDSQLEKVKKELYQARKPVLFIGGGINVAGAGSLVKEFVEKTNIPVVSSLMGIGSIPSNHPLYLGMVGMHGTFAANKAVHHTDLLICLGVRFSDRVTGKISGFSPKSRKIQVDIDPSELNKIVKVDIPIVGDVKELLQQLNPMVDSLNTDTWIKDVLSWDKKVPRYSIDDINSKLKPQQVIELLDQYSKSNAIVATDVGQHQIWTSHYYQFQHNRTFLTSGGLGTMGYGLPAAIGAAFSDSGREVILISGDGSFQMNFRELLTVATYQLPIKIVILKNNYLGMVRQWQEMFYKRRYSSVNISSPNFVKLAESYGIQSFHANNLVESEKIIKQAFQMQKPVVLEFDITEEENVFPIVPPGKNNTEALSSAF